MTQWLFVLSKHAKGDKKLFFLVELLGPGVMTGDAGGQLEKGSPLGEVCSGKHWIGEAQPLKA